MTKSQRVEFNPAYHDPEFMHEFKTAFENRKTCAVGCDVNTTAKILCTDDSFPVVQLENIVDDSVANQVLSDVLAQDYYRKSNDLYSFLQSEDLRLSKVPSLASLRSELASEKFVSWLSALTGIELCPGKMDFAAQRYMDMDRLLCHDDDIVESGGVVRRIAFIFYLVDPKWTAECGGQLQIFSADPATCLPTCSVVNSVIPKWNSLAFFEVSPTSYHQVAEVLTDRMERVSITGWFYGPLDVSRWPESARAVSSPLNVLKTFDGEFPLDHFIRPEYLDAKLMSQIQAKFAEESFVELQRVFIDHVYENVARQLSNVFSGLRLTGPPNVQLCNSLGASANLPKELAAFLSMTNSTSFTNWINSLTGMDVDANFKSELKQFNAGNYTLLHDNAREEPGLDMLLSLMPQCEWDESWGGDVVYLDNDDEALLNLYPVSNSMALVYRDEGVMRFVRYINHHAGHNSRTNLFITWPIEENADE